MTPEAFDPAKPPAERLSFVCAWTIFRKPTSRLARGRVTWPFGRLELDDTRLVLSIRGPVGWVLSKLARYSHVPLPVVIPLGTIRRVETVKHRPRGLKVRCASSHVDGVAFLLFGRRFDRVLDRLRRCGIPVDADGAGRGS